MNARVNLGHVQNSQGRLEDLWLHALSLEELVEMVEATLATMPPPFQTNLLRPGRVGNNTREMRAAVASIEDRLTRLVALEDAGRLGPRRPSARPRRAPSCSTTGTC
jgi:hypothetical protein